MEDRTQRHHRRIDDRGRRTRTRAIAIAGGGGHDYDTVLGFADTVNELITGGRCGRTGVKVEDTDLRRWRRVLPRSGISSDSEY